jgi:uncharacterized protein (DUF924 family)
VTTEATSSVVDAEDVLDFWFADAASGPQAVERRNRVWFAGGAHFDRECTERFAATLEAAAGGDLDHWKESPRGRLALIILLDQFSRNIYRGTAAAFQHDDRARAACREGIAVGHDEQLAPFERSFFYMPLEHAEDREVQALSVRLFETLANESPEEWRGRLKADAGHARRHRDIVEEFGRFPHRNAVLRRDSSPAEQAYLADDAPRFGQ